MAKSRRRVTRRSAPRKRFRTNVLHPLTGEPIKLEERSAMALEGTKARFQQLRDELRQGRRTHESFATEVHLLTKGKLPAESTIPRVRDAWAAYLPTVVHPHSRGKAESVWKNHLEPAIGGELVATLTDARLDLFVASLQREGHSSSYITSTIWAFLSAAIRHLKRAKRIERLPWDDFKPPRVVTKNRPAAATQVSTIASLALAARDSDDKDRATYARKGPGWHGLSPLFDLERRVIVLTLCGMRNGEGAGLGWDKVNAADNHVTIDVQALDQWRKHFPDKTRPDFPTKNSKVDGPLVQTLHPDARRALEEQKRELEALGWYRDDGPVFPSKGGDWRSNANCIYPEDLRRIAIASGIPNAKQWVTHSLRHSFSTLELKHSGDPRATADRTGHASIRQLEQYVHSEGGAPSAIPALTGMARGKSEEGRRPP